jgi:miniconductance mechanosensitive channel
MLTLVSAASVLPSFIASSIAFAQAEVASTLAGAPQAATNAATNAATSAAPETAQVAATMTTPTIAPAVAAPPDPAQEAMLRIVRALEDTAFGQWLREHEVLWNLIAIGSLIALGFVLNLVLRRVLSTIVARALAKAKRERLAAAIVSSKLLVPIAAIAPLLLVARLVGVLGTAGAINALLAFNVSNVLVAIAILRGMGAVSRFLAVADELYSSRPEVNRPGALRGYRQVAMVALALVGGISAAAIAVGKSPVVFLAALGAAGAILGVVFKDVLFSLVANLMLTANDAIRQGDWVEMKQHGIDGRIAEIKTTAVRVQNADGTVHAIPISRFVQEPYLNYRSKYGSPGRRVRRSVRVDVRSVRALDAQDLARLERDNLATSPEMKGVAERARQAAGAAGAVTNLCVFRAFVERFLAANDAIDASLPIVVTQQEASATGVPVEVLCFIKPNAAPDLASVEGAIVDRMTLAAERFGLRLYQAPNDIGPSVPPPAFLQA